jgi:LPS-assembly lipoprotein
MSLRDRKSAPAALVLGLVLALAGCTVRPLYMKDSATTTGSTAGMAANLASIAVNPVGTRYAQLVRNELIFLLGGGAGEATNPRYTLALNVSSSRQATASAATSTIDEVNVPTAAIVTLKASYTLTDAASGQRVASGKRAVTSSIDVPRQQYAALSAEQDAQARSARELAELLRLAIAQDLAKGGGK